MPRVSFGLMSFRRNFLPSSIRNGFTSFCMSMRAPRELPSSGAKARWWDKDNGGGTLGHGGMGTWGMGAWGHGDMGTWGHGDTGHGDMGHGAWGQGHGAVRGSFRMPV